MNPRTFYETMYAGEQHESPPLNREQAAFELLDGGRKFLDVGCGPGRLVLLAAQKFSEVYGIDIVASMIRYAQEKVESLGSPIGDDDLISHLRSIRL